MSRILDNIHETREPIERPVMPSLGCSIGTSCSPTITCARESQYKLEVRLAMKFWASKEAYPEERRRAEQAFLREVHHDVLAHMPRLRSALLAEDFHGAWKICGELEKDMGL